MDGVITVIFMIIIFSLIATVIYQNISNAKAQSDAAAAAYATALAASATKEKESEESKKPVEQEITINPDDLYLSQEPLDYKSGWWGTDGTWPNTKYSSKYPQPAGAYFSTSSLPLPTVAGSGVDSYSSLGYDRYVFSGSNIGISASNASTLGSNVSDPNAAFYSLTTHF
jgi:hypothetical protein